MWANRNSETCRFAESLAIVKGVAPSAMHDIAEMTGNEGNQLAKTSTPIPTATRACPLRTDGFAAITEIGERDCIVAAKSLGIQQESSDNSIVIGAPANVHWRFAVKWRCLFSN